MRKVAIVLVAVLVCGLAVAGDIQSTSRPAIFLESANGLTRISVEVSTPEGVAERHLIRETTAPVTAGLAGGNPARTAAFASWRENGTETWSAWSRDGGASWSEARPTPMDLRLRAGAANPWEALPDAPALGLPSNGNLFIVQLRSISLPEWRSTLESAGGQILAFFPNNAHIVRMDAGARTRIAGLEFVQRVEPYRPSDRLEPALQAWLSAPEGPEAQRVNAVVFEWGASAKERLAAAAVGVGARVDTAYPTGHIVELTVTRDQLRALSGHDDLMWVDRWSGPENDMDLVRQDSGADYAEATWSECGQGVRGEVLDAGIEATHMDFDGVLLHTAANVDSHGTSTYGIVFGNGNRDGDGNAQGTGQVICSSQGIFADYDNMGDRFTHTQQLKSSPYFASFQSNSWGNALTTAYTSISNQMDDIIWRLDIAIAQSQSNAGTRSSRPQAWAKNIISVGGEYHQNTLATGDDCWCNGASIGPAEDNRIKPDVSYWYDSIFTTTTGNTYTSAFGGTSAATPATAGVIGLIVQMWSDNVWNTNPVGSTVFERQPHASTIKSLLVNNASQYPFTGTAADLTRVHQGWGRPNARTARERAAKSFVVDETTPLQVGQAASYSLTVDPGQPDLKVTMSYPDPPGTISATLHRINNLDLKVTSPSGTIYNGNNGLTAGNWSTSGGSPNNVDTVENVFVQAPQAGSWNVEVRASEINQDAVTSTPAADADFSLVVTGAYQGAPPVCGDLTCNGGETRCSCPGDCGAPPATEVPGSTCNDGINNDCDAATDCADSNCTAAPECTCKPLGQACTNNNQCCSNRCRGGKNKTCQ